MAKAIADAAKVTMKLENERKKRKDPLRLLIWSGGLSSQP